MSNEPGLISIGALYTTEEYCDTLPTRANEACNETFTNKSGVIMSPCYPSYYRNNANCNSTIIANQGYVIRLDIAEFELEMSTRCEDDSVDVYDGGKRIGRYCGIRKLHNNSIKESEISVDAFSELKKLKYL
ncbi:Cubilin [Exaiptasia diaphana]|nr:Cubilin [Exaiptasia diaphana]